MTAPPRFACGHCLTGMLFLFHLIEHSSCDNFLNANFSPHPEPRFSLQNGKISQQKNQNYHGDAKLQSHGMSEIKYFDLSYSFDDTTIFYPGQRFDFHQYQDIGPTWKRTRDDNYQFSFASWSFCMAEHGGTHMDAPFHFNRFGWRLNEIPLSRLIDVPATVIDVERHVFSLVNPEKFRFQVEHIKDHEARYGPIPPESLVFVHYGWGRFWPDRIRYSGWNNATSGRAAPTLNHPTISGDAASWLLRERNIVGIGIDAMSPDPDPNVGDQTVHIQLLENQVYIIENVANLADMLEKIRSSIKYSNACNLRMTALPIKITGTGGPVRLTAYCKQW